MDRDPDRLGRRDGRGTGSRGVLRQPVGIHHPASARPCRRPDRWARPVISFGVSGNEPGDVDRGRPPDPGVLSRSHDGGHRPRAANLGRLPDCVGTAGVPAPVNALHGADGRPPHPPPRRVARRPASPSADPGRGRTGCLVRFPDGDRSVGRRPRAVGSRTDPGNRICTVSPHGGHSGGRVSSWARRHHLAPAAASGCTAGSPSTSAPCGSRSAASRSGT